MAEKIDIGFFKQVDGRFDIEIDPEDGDLRGSIGMTTAIQMTIFCEQRATAGEVPDAFFRRGWIGNIDSEFPGFEIGSKIWLYDQARLTSDTINGINNAAFLASSWFFDDKIVTNIKSNAIFDSINDQIQLQVNFAIAHGAVDTLFFDLWKRTV